MTEQTLTGPSTTTSSGAGSDTTGATAAGATFRVLLRAEIHPGMEADFERTWLDVGDAIIGHPHNRGQWLLRSEDEDHVYYIISDWVDEERFREFEHSEAHVGHRTKLHPFRARGSMTTMRIVHALGEGPR
ncbi:antibiotic biosynthesis monooxygenase family protein [Nocardiopsis alba]|uniref:antibiotic biosynthesis monooxygenase family protein n=1 Tax=Nocardiopsis alba TaxID=53437 RepID=UPI0033BB9671